MRSYYDNYCNTGRNKNCRFMLLQFFKWKESCEDDAEFHRIKLPESAQIQEYQYNKDGSYYIKIEIDANDIPVVRERLSAHFDREFNYDDVDEKNRLDFSTCKWWDMEKYNVQYAYAAGITSHGPRGAVSRWGRMYMSVTEWAFLVKASQEKEYLYISAYLSIKLPEEKN